MGANGRGETVSSLTDPPPWRTPQSFAQIMRDETKNPLKVNSPLIFPPNIWPSSRRPFMPRSRAGWLAGFCLARLCRTIGLLSILRWDHQLGRPTCRKSKQDQTDRTSWAIPWLSSLETIGASRGASRLNIFLIGIVDCGPETTTYRRPTPKTACLSGAAAAARHDYAFLRRLCGCWLAPSAGPQSPPPPPAPRRVISSGRYSCTIGVFVRISLKSEFQVNRPKILNSQFPKYCSVGTN